MRKVLLSIILTMALIVGLIVAAVPVMADSSSDPAPAIDIEKLVSVDGGATWVDADVAPGPTATFPGTVKFKVIVTNTGNVPLTDVVVTDTDFTFTGVVTSLAVGAADESDILSVASVVGQHSDNATVNALYNTTPVTDSDLAYYYVEPVTAHVVPPGWSHGKKTDWNDGDTPPGWSKGKKTGWNGGDTPPGWSKGKKTGWSKNN